MKFRDKYELKPSIVIIQILLNILTQHYKEYNRFLEYLLLLTKDEVFRNSLHDRERKEILLLPACCGPVRAIWQETEKINRA